MNGTGVLYGKRALPAGGYGGHHPPKSDHANHGQGEAAELVVYHKVHLIVGIIAVIFAASVIWSFVSKENPDYYVAIMTEYMLPVDLQLDLEEHLEQYADDRNGDGEVAVALQYYQFSTDGTTDYDAAQLQASFVKFAADASNADSIIFIYDDASYE